jgi:hypothetical protein
MIKHPLFGFGAEFVLAAAALPFLSFVLFVTDDGELRFLGALCANPDSRSRSIIFHTFSI